MTSVVERLARVTLRQARRIVVLVFGITLLGIGLLMLVLPGPGILAIVAALALLGLEFAWARHWLRRVKEVTRSVHDGVRSRIGYSERRPPPERKQLP
jgi:tellurite resistance protein TerC